jgi:hypothetical protein
MIKVKDIIKWSNPHPLEGGKITRLYNKEIEFSIVGGRSGLYGDFINDFEVAILDNKNGEFITKFFYPELNDEVIGYMKGKDLEELINKVFRKDNFQVR